MMKRKLPLLIFGLLILIILAGVGVRYFLLSSGKSAEIMLYRVPRVLIITTGKDGTGALPEGVILTMESFIRNGAYTRLNTRDALLDEEYLAQFDILLMLTAIEYHDADRQYSLTFFEDLELEIIRKWVANGGVLIGGDNIGRNLRNGADRISIYGRLEPDNWPLAPCFGVMMSERNMEGFSLHGDIADTLRGELLPALGPGSWILVPDSVLSDQTTILASWKNDSMQFPALIMNPYGKGIGFLLPSSYLLHPSNEGGHWNAMQIDAFCQVVLEAFYRRFPVEIGLHPWPEGRQAAFAVSLNSDGSLKDYRHVFGLLKQRKITPTLFVNGTLDEEIAAFLKTVPHQLQSNGLTKTNMQNLTFSETVFQIEMNERRWQQDFTGFRFPFTLNSVWGMEYLQRKGYNYESSIGADHMYAFYGSLFPYYLPVFQGENYQVLDLLEIGPLSLDDYFYFRMIQEETTLDKVVLDNKAQLFNEYLQQFWKNKTIPSGGMMVYLGHPIFSGLNDTTSRPLANIIDTARHYGAWMTTMEEIADRWHNLDKLRMTVSGSKERYTLTTALPEGVSIEGVTLRISRKPKKVKAAEGACTLQQEQDHWLIIFNARNGQRIDLVM